MLFEIKNCKAGLCLYLLCRKKCDRKLTIVTRSSQIDEYQLVLQKHIEKVCFCFWVDVVTSYWIE
jgi:hypothetical protein